MCLHTYLLTYFHIITNKELNKPSPAELEHTAPLIRHVLGNVDAARYTNCYACMYVRTACTMRL